MCSCVSGWVGPRLCVSNARPPGTPPPRPRPTRKVKARQAPPPPPAQDSGNMFGTFGLGPRKCAMRVSNVPTYFFARPVYSGVKRGWGWELRASMYASGRERSETALAGTRLCKKTTACCTVHTLTLLVLNPNNLQGDLRLEGPAPQFFHFG